MVVLGVGNGWAAVLDVPQCYSGVEGGGDEAVAEAVGADSFVDPGPSSESFDGAVSGVAVHPLARHTKNDRAGRPPIDAKLDGPGRAGGEGDQGPFAALAGDVQGVMASLEPKIADVSVQRLGHPQPIQRQQGREGVVTAGPDPGLDHEGAEFVAIQAKGSGLAVHLGATDVRGRVLGQVPSCSQYR